MSNQAAWIKEEKARIEVGPADLYTPRDHELLVENESISFNPVEAKLQKWAIFPIAYPAILGNSFAGTVKSIGPNVTRFKPGDRVVVGLGNPADTRTGSHQKFAIASDTASSKIPDSVPTDEASAIIMNLATVVGALDVFAKLDRPTAGAQGKGNVLIYGGSTSVGGYGIQYARSAGYNVITTSSQRNHEYVSSLKPTKIVDHNKDPAAVTEELKAHGPYVAVFDTTASPVVVGILSDVVSSSNNNGGTKTILSVGPLMDPSVKLADGVEHKFDSFPVVLGKDKDASKWYYQEYLPSVLEKKEIVPTRIEKVTGGLEAIQGVLDRILTVSGVKLILDPRT